VELFLTAHVVGFMKTKILFILALGIATPAYADHMISTLGQPIHEVSHTVNLSVEEGVATYRVQRTFANSGTVPDEAVLLLNLPEGAVATGLRIRAGQRWYEGELLEREEAAQRYEELTGIGVFTLMDPALLSWVGPRNLELRVFPVPVGGTATLDYTLSAPVHWDEGRWHTTYPKQDPEEGHFAPIILSVQAGKDHGAVWVESRRVGFESPVVLTPLADEDSSYEYDDMTQIHIRPETQVVRARLGSTHLARVSEIYADYQMEVPARLSETPKSAHAVFVVDRSRSLSLRDLDAQIEIMLAFANHLPDGQFQVILVDRFAEPLLNEFASSSDFNTLLNQLRHAPLKLKNGSNLDLGLEQARSLLHGVEGPKYIIAFTDDYLRRTLDVLALRGSPDITTHVVVIGESWRRDDDHRLAGIAEATGGILVHASVTDELEQLSEHLVRPTMLEFVRIEGLEPDFGEIKEGEVYQFIDVVEKRPERGFGTINAKLWHKSIRVVPDRSKRLDKAIAGWVFARDMHTNLDHDDQMKLARFANAVTPVTSFLAIEPGVRPSSEGLPWGAFGVGGMGTRGFGAGGSGSARGTVQIPTMDSLFDSVADACRARHPNLHAVVAVHTTKEEIVDVTPRSPTNTFGDCLVEGIWEIELPANFQAIAYSTHSISY